MACVKITLWKIRFVTSLSIYFDVMYKIFVVFLSCSCLSKQCSKFYLVYCIIHLYSELFYNTIIVSQNMQSI